MGILNPARILSPRRRSRNPHHIAPEDDNAHDVPRVIVHDVIKSQENLSDPTAAVDWIRRERLSILDRLARAGVVLLRGFPLENAEEFDSAVVAFNLGRFSYRDSLSNAVRKDVTDRVFTANEAPPEATIRLHHELAQPPAISSSVSVPRATGARRLYAAPTTCSTESKVAIPTSLATFSHTGSPIIT